MTLQEILDELTVHCNSVTGKRCVIKLILPDAVIDQFNLVFRPKELIQLGSPSKDMYSFLCTLHGNGGTVELYRDSDFMVDTRLEEEV